MYERLARVNPGRQGNTIPLFERPFLQKALNDRTIPTAQHAVKYDLEIGEKSGVRHVIRVELMLGRQYH